jgi:ribosomal protein S18 acetylase RimI-like enzyme
MDIEYRIESPHKNDLHALYEHLGWNQYLRLNPDQLLEAMNGSFYSVYAYSGNSLIGTGRVISDGMISAYVCGLGVHSEFRHRGIGKTIMIKLCRYCSDRNLHIQFFCEEHLVKYYEQIGFVPFARGMMKVRNSSQTTGSSNHNTR